MARVFIAGDPFFCDALARRLRPLRDQGVVELLGEPEIADERLDRIRREGGGFAMSVRPEQVAQVAAADVVVLLLDARDLDPRHALGNAVERAREGDATLLVVRGRELEQNDSRLNGLAVVPPGDLSYYETRDPEGYLGRVVSAVHDAILRLDAAKLTRMSVKHLTVFDDVTLEFCPGINVLLGPNGSGKTHLLKLLYVALFVEQYKRMRPSEDVADLLTRKLIGVFKPADEALSRILTRTAPGQVGTLKVETTSGAIDASLSVDGSIQIKDGDPLRTGRPVFIPSREMLTTFEGLLGLAAEHRLSIDDTMIDLCQKLDKPAALRRDEPIWRPVFEEIEGVIGGQVRKPGQRFYVRGPAGEIEAHLLAEGHRKLATLVRLLEVGELRSGTVLCWDEPEANLNPLLVKPIVGILHRLARAGVQVFLATHDYLFAYRLSMAAEFGTEPGVEHRFFALDREEGGAATVEWGDSMSKLTRTPILDELLAFYDERKTLFASSAQRTGR